MRRVLRSQFHAALGMLEQAVRRCPEALWDDPTDTNRFWHVAYHVLFYTDFYLSDDEASYEGWPLGRPSYQFMGPVPWPPHDKPVIGAPYGREDVLAYVAFCRDRIDVQLAAVDLDAPSGFPWLPFGKLELQIYTIRHIQQHTGELMERLGARAGVDVPWVGMSGA
ncbi:MAG: DinB family protein [Ardenticatenales bacterium]